MKQLRYLIDAEVDKADRARQDNGVMLSSYSKVAESKIQVQELTDEISASIYGADVNRMYRVSSPRYSLEAFLFSKVNNSSDNVSLYSLVINGLRYRIVTVRKNWVDIELIGKVESPSI